MTVTATPRGRRDAQVFQADMKKVGIDDRDQAGRPDPAGQGNPGRDFQVSGWRIIDLADVDPQMFANFHSEPDQLLRLQQSGSRPAADGRSHPARRETCAKAACCDLIKILNDDVVWLWTGSNIRLRPSSGTNVRGDPGPARRRGCRSRRRGWRNSQRISASVTWASACIGWLVNCCDWSSCCSASRC